MDYPLIFLGYSLEDENILSILYSLIDCLNDDQISKLSNRLIYVTWKQNENKLICSKKTITKNGKTLTLTNIETDNYFIIYKYLQKFYPYEKPERVRKFKKMIRNLIYNNNKGSNTLITTNENLDNLNETNKLVVAFGSTEEFTYKGLVGLTVPDLCKKVLSQETCSKKFCEEIIKNCYINNSKVAFNHFAPIFYFLKNTNKFSSNNKIQNLSNNMKNFINKLLDDPSIPTFDSNDSIVKKFKMISKSKRMLSLIKSYSLDVITYSEYLLAINSIIDDSSLDYDITDTIIKKAITYADFKQ